MRRSGRYRAATTATAAVAALALLAVAGCTVRRPRQPGSTAQPATSVTPDPAPPGLAWRTLARAPSERTEVVATVAAGRVYVVGGLRLDGSPLSAVEIYDIAADRWGHGPDLPLSVHHAMATTIADTVYVFGGYLASGTPSAVAFRLGPSGWQSIAPMPLGRAAGTAVAQDGQVYVAGGVGPAGLAREMMVYDPAADRWSLVDGPPTPREHLGGAGFNGLVYTAGGRTGGVDTNLNAFEVYDPRSRQWTSLPPLPTRRGGLAAAMTCSGLLVAVGGEASATFAAAEAYDVRSGRWLALPALPTARHGLGVTAAGSTILTVAGGPQPGLYVSDAVEAIDLAGLGECAPAGQASVGPPQISPPGAQPPPSQPPTEQPPTG